jgi:methylenetetrahydrofolate reductase (NADPH)
MTLKKLFNKDSMHVIKEPVISFEFFPPKTPEGSINLLSAASNLISYEPSFMSVTFGAGGSTRSGTLDTISMLKEKTGANVAPHLSCVGSTASELLEIIKRYQDIGVRRLVALRGDMPSGMVNSGEFHYASELVHFIRQQTGDYFHIEVAAYPEFHPQAKSVHDDVINLKRKYEMGANSALTQYFFNADAYFYYLDDCAHSGIHIPIIPGIMPITQFSSLARFSDVCGAEIPRWIRKRLESYGDDVHSIQQFGLEVVVGLCQQLLAGGAPGLHFYTLNKDKPCIEILSQLDIVGVTGELNEAVSS